MASSAASLIVSDVPVDVDDEPEDELEDEPEELLPEWLPARLPARLPACPSALSPVDVLLPASDDCVSFRWRSLPPVNSQTAFCYMYHNRPPSR